MTAAEQLEHAVARALDDMGPTDTLSVLRSKLREVRQLVAPTALEHAEADTERLGGVLQDEIPPGWGYALVTFTMSSGTQPRMTYVGNGDRRSVAVILRDMAGRLLTGEGRV